MNQVYLGDCLEVMRSFADKSVDCVLTDIPYGAANRGSNGLRDLDKGVADIFTLDMDTLLSELCRVSKGQIIIFCGKEQFSGIYSFFADIGTGTVRPIVWEKTNPSPMNGQYIYTSGVEMAVWYKPSGRKVFNAFCKNSVFRFPSGTRKLHPTQKNMALWEELILDNTNAGEVVLDPFAGSGTTGVACINTQRDYILIEKEQKYYDIIHNRLADAWLKGLGFEATV